MLSCSPCSFPIMAKRTKEIEVFVAKGRPDYQDFEMESKGCVQ